MNNETIEIIKEAKKAGLEIAGLFFLTLVMITLIFALLFGFYIYKTYEVPPSTKIEAEQTTNLGNNHITNGVK